MEERVTAADDNHVWVLTVRGNYKHRIMKVGIEKLADEDLTGPQERLREAVVAQQLDGKPGRPDWAKGALVFVTVAHAACIEDVMQEWQSRTGNELKSKYVIVSDSLKETLMEALSGGPPADIKPKEAFQYRRGGEIAEEERIKMKSMRDVEQTLQELEAAIEKEAACQHNSLCCQPDWYGWYCQICGNQR